MDFSWSAFFAGVIIAFPLGWLIADLIEARGSPEKDRRDAAIRTEIRDLRWMICELEAGRRPPMEVLENIRAAVELDRKAEETLKEWDARKAQRHGSRARWFRRKGNSA